MSARAPRLDLTSAAGVLPVDTSVAESDGPHLARSGRRSHRVDRSRGWLVHRMLVAADAFGLTSAFVLTEIAVAGHPGADHVGLPQESLLFALTLPFWVLLAKLHGLYDNDEARTDHTTADDLIGLLHLVTFGLWVFLAAGWLTGWAAPSVPKLLMFWVLAVVCVGISRTVARTWARRSDAYVQNTLIVGAGAVGQLVARKFLTHPEYGINVLGFVDAEPMEPQGDGPRLPVLGTPEMLHGLIEELQVRRVVIAFSLDSHEESLRVIRDVTDLDVRIDVVPRLYEILGVSAHLHAVEGLPLVSLPYVRLSRSSRLLKRTMDLMLGAAGLALLGIPFALIGILIKLDSSGPVFFRQLRMGSGETAFRILKFRTMRRDAELLKPTINDLNMHEFDDPRMFKVPEDPRVTRVGRILRRFSLDELPQLINVVRGDMSLVGPRPLVLDEDQHVRDWARKRLRIKPGMTGLWQVLGASDIPFGEMTRLDYAYVTSWSLWTDVKLLFLTLPAILRSRRAY
jgi:exopolysaccharide biosynthesis polyprenyl glycosylphosphotransferase